MNFRQLLSSTHYLSKPEATNLSQVLNVDSSCFKNGIFSYFRLKQLNTNFYEQKRLEKYSGI